jgi:hypothetical protein
LLDPFLKAVDERVSSRGDASSSAVASYKSKRDC